jgi:DNA-binding NarL/FixJ family response regulator
MPEKEGIETIIELRRRQPLVKLIAISGGGRTNSVDFLDLARQLGADAALRKPIAMKRLVETINSVMSASISPPLPC